MYSNLFVHIVLASRCYSQMFGLSCQNWIQVPLLCKANISRGSQKGMLFYF